MGVVRVTVTGAVSKNNGSLTEAELVRDQLGLACPVDLIWFTRSAEVRVDESHTDFKIGVCIIYLTVEALRLSYESYSSFY